MVALDKVFREWNRVQCRTNLQLDVSDSQSDAHSERLPNDDPLLRKCYMLLSYGEDIPLRSEDEVGCPVVPNGLSALGWSFWEMSNP